MIDGGDGDESSRRTHHPAPFIPSRICVLIPVCLAGGLEEVGFLSSRDARTKTRAGVNTDQWSKCGYGCYLIRWVKRKPEGNTGHTCRSYCSDNAREKT
jgi:hypothetical protein